MIVSSSSQTRRVVGGRSDAPTDTAPPVQSPALDRVELLRTLPACTTPASSSSETAAQPPRPDLVECLIRAGLPHRSRVLVDGIHYRLLLQNEWDCGSLEDRVESAALWTRRHCLTGNSCVSTGGARHSAALERFQTAEAAIASAFAHHARRLMDDGSRNAHPIMRRVAVSCHRVRTGMRHHRLALLTLGIPSFAVIAPLFVSGIAPVVATAASVVLAVVSAVTGRNILDSVRADTKSRRNAALIRLELASVRVDALRALDAWPQSAVIMSSATRRSQPCTAMHANTGNREEYQARTGHGAGCLLVDAHVSGP